MPNGKGKGLKREYPSAQAAQLQQAESVDVSTQSLSESSARTSAEGSLTNEPTILNSMERIFGTRRYFRRSLTPEEDTEELPKGGMWPVEKVNRFEIDCMGRITYQVAWKDWKRKDGTNMTWEELIPTSEPMLEFAREVKAKAEAEARSSKGIDLTKLCRHMPHDFFTGEALQGYEEKMRRYVLEESLIDEREWDCEAHERRLATRNNNNPIESSNGTTAHAESSQVQRVSESEATLTSSSGLRRKRSLSRCRGSPSEDMAIASSSSQLPTRRRRKRSLSRGRGSPSEGMAIASSSSQPPTRRRKN